MDIESQERQEPVVFSSSELRRRSRVFPSEDLKRQLQEMEDDYKVMTIGEEVCVTFIAFCLLLLLVFCGKQAILAI